MELVIVILSLMWVVGVLSLQRIDTISDEFARAVAYYLSVDDNGAVLEVHLEINSLMPKAGIIKYAAKVFESRKPVDRKLHRSLRFFAYEKRYRNWLEMPLVAATVVLPLAYRINFSGDTWLTFLDKDAILYAVFSLFVVWAIVSVRLINYWAEKCYPLSFASQTAIENALRPSS